jgi:hypothetical protein
MNVKKIAQDAIIAAGIVPAKDVVVDGFVNSDWDGSPLVLIVSEPTESEECTQFGVLNVTTLMEIHTFAQTEQEAMDIERQAAAAVWNKLEELERERRSGIYCVTYVNHNTFQMNNRSEYQSMFTFRVLHKP